MYCIDDGRCAKHLAKHQMLKVILVSDKVGVLLYLLTLNI